MYFCPKERFKLGTINRKGKSDIARFMQNDMFIFCFKGIEDEF